MRSKCLELLISKDKWLDISEFPWRAGEHRKHLSKANFLEFMSLSCYSYLKCTQAVCISEFQKMGPLLGRNFRCKESKIVKGSSSLSEGQSCAWNANLYLFSSPFIKLHLHLTCCWREFLKHIQVFWDLGSWIQDDWGRHQSQCPAHYRHSQKVCVINDCM